MLVLRLLTAHGEVRVPLADRPVVVGRDPACDVVLEDPTLSRRHARIEPFAGGTDALLRDLQSSNGTWVDERRLDGAEIVRPGQRLRFGSLAAELLGPPVPGTPPPAATTALTAVHGTPAADAATAAHAAPAGGWTGQAAAAPAVAFHPAPPAPVPDAHGTHRRGVLLGVLGSLSVALVAVLVVVLVSNGADPPVQATNAPALPSEMAATVEDVIADASPATVLVTGSIQGERVGSGTGWVLDGANGLVVTNHHVIGFADALEVGFGDRFEDATVVGTAPCEDIALLRVPGMTDLPSLPLGRQDDLRLGETVIALGYPGNASQADDLAATTGIVSIVRTTLDEDTFDAPRYPNLVQTDAAINPGNSGGPLLNLDGELVGMNSAGITLLGGRIIQGQGYAIGVDRLREVLPELEDGESWAWTGLGLLHPLGAEDFAPFGLEPGPGLIVTGAQPGTPAADDPGLDPPARLVEVDGTPMDGSLPTYCDAVGEARSGDDVDLLVVPAGESGARDVSVPLA